MSDKDEKQKPVICPRCGTKNSWATYKCQGKFYGMDCLKELYNLTIII